jgi:uncharacterized tellurite resistance protein B-like protein
MQLESEQILSGYSSREKAAYLGALASLATADRHADEEEVEHFNQLAQAAGLTDEESQTILKAADDNTGQYLLGSLDALKNSELRFSLVTDLIALAKADDNYSSSEEADIEKVSRYLGVDHDQFKAIDQFVDQAARQEPKAPAKNTTSNFLDSPGLQNKLQGAGINIGSIGKGLISILGPMILGRIAAKGLGGSRRNIPGGLGGMFGNNPMGGGSAGGFGGLGGGLGSIIAGMTRGRSNHSIGDMLGRLLR